MKWNRRHFLRNAIRAGVILGAPNLLVRAASPQFLNPAFFRKSVAAVGGGGGGGSDDLTGIGVRYVADDVSGTDGTAVSAWSDSGGSGYNLSQSTGAQQPLIRVSAVNGHRAVEFDGSNDNMTAASVPPSAVGTATANAIFVVMKQAGTQDTNTVFRYDSSSGMEVFASYSDVLYYDNAGNSGGQRVNGSQPSGWDDAWHLFEAHRSGTNMSILVDGSSIATGSSNSVNFDQTGTASLWVGAYAGNIINFKGQIAELRIYNVDKDSTSSATIRASLKSRYGTP